MSEKEDIWKLIAEVGNIKDVEVLGFKIANSIKPIEDGASKIYIGRNNNWRVDEHLDGSASIYYSKSYVQFAHDVDRIEKARKDKVKNGLGI